MKLNLCIGLALCSVLVPGAAVAKNTVLQIVDLSEMGLSTEGGEATLYRVNYAKRAVCKIEVIHFGEMGRKISEFEFGSKLYSAEEKEYRYSAPLSENPKAKLILANKMTLKTQDGQGALPEAFETYKALFDAAKVAGCEGR